MSRGFSFPGVPGICVIESDVAPSSEETSQFEKEAEADFNHLNNWIASYSQELKKRGNDELQTAQNR